jgi:predicted dehydrogenase
VKRVAALASIPAKERTISSKPRAGEKIPVSTPTTILALMEFDSGAVFTFNASWDVWDSGHAPMELYGEQGTIHMPDPNFFGGGLRYTRGEKPVKTLPKWDHPFSVANEKHPHGMMANYRTAGLADMALAIMQGRPHRCSLELANHVIDIMTGILKSGETKKFVDMQTSCERPEPLGPTAARGLLAPSK